MKSLWAIPIVWGLSCVPGVGCGGGPTFHDDAVAPSVEAGTDFWGRPRLKITSNTNVSVPKAKLTDEDYLHPDGKTVLHKKSFELEDFLMTTDAAVVREVNVKQIQAAEPTYKDLFSMIEGGFYAGFGAINPMAAVNGIAHSISKASIEKGRVLNQTEREAITTQLWGEFINSPEFEARVAGRVDELVRKKMAEQEKAHIDAEIDAAGPATQPEEGDGVK